VNSERFLAFKRYRGGGRYRGTLENPVELEAGVNYDLALEIDQRNDWKEIGEADLDLIESLIEVAARGLNELLMFCFHGQQLDRKGRGLRTAIRRFIAVAWLVNSSLLVSSNGMPLSLEQLSKLRQIKCTRCSLSLLAQKFGDKWGFHARVQKRVETKPNNARAAVRGWAKRRERQTSQQKPQAKTSPKKQSANRPANRLPKSG
jgi:hypothetical protein